jgi:hypothetical protein
VHLAPTEAISYRKSNPIHLGAEGTRMLRVCTCIPTQVLGPWYQLRACLTHLVVAPCGSMVPTCEGAMQLPAHQLTVLQGRQQIDSSCK